MGHGKKETEMLRFLHRELEEFVRTSPLESRRGGQVHSPHVDIYETEDYLYIDIDLPGVKKEDINCYISPDELYVEAIKKISSPEKKAHFYCMERYFGTFRRTIEIPAVVNTSKIEARLVDGILHITLPKIHDRRVRKRKVEIK